MAMGLLERKRGSVWASRLRRRAIQDSASLRSLRNSFASFLSLTQAGPFPPPPVKAEPSIATRALTVSPSPFATWQRFRIGGLRPCSWNPLISAHEFPPGCWLSHGVSPLERWELGPGTIRPSGMTGKIDVRGEAGPSLLGMAGIRLIDPVEVE